MNQLEEREYGPWPRVEETICFPVQEYPPKFVKLHCAWPLTEFEWEILMDLLAVWKRGMMGPLYGSSNVTSLLDERDALEQQVAALQQWGQQVHDALDGKPLPEHCDEAPARITALRQQVEELKAILRKRKMGDVVLGLQAELTIARHAVEYEHANALTGALATFRSYRKDERDRLRGQVEEAMDAANWLTLQVEKLKLALMDDHYHYLGNGDCVTRVDGCEVCALLNPAPQSCDHLWGSTEPIVFVDSGERKRILFCHRCPALKWDAPQADSRSTGDGNG